MRLLGLITIIIAGCSSAPVLPKVGPPVAASKIAAIKAMPKGQAQVNAIAALIADAQPAITMEYDAMSAHERADRAATTAHFAGRIVVLSNARVERSWSAKEDADGIATVQVHSTDRLVSSGLRFGKADESRVLKLRPGQTVTATCLLLDGMPGYVADALSTAGCTLTD